MARLLWQFIALWAIATAVLYYVVRRTSGQRGAWRAVLVGTLGLAGMLWAMYAVAHARDVSIPAMVAGLTVLWGAMLYLLAMMVRRTGALPGLNARGTRLMNKVHDVQTKD